MLFSRKRLILKIWLIVSIITVSTLIVIHDVKRSVSHEDRIYLSFYLSDVNFVTGSERTFEEEIRLIRSVQQQVLSINPIGEGIPHNKSRRPKDVYESKGGLCYDRSFLLELLFTELGFQVRHVSIFSDVEGSGFLQDLFTKGISSHAVSEVRTTKGWLLVDSNHPWVGLDDKGNPYSMKGLRANIEWESAPPNELYLKPKHFIYGLYSRHGKFYPPYNFIPDYHFRDMLYNF